MLTPEQLKARQRSLGASELAAIAGLSKWKTAVDVWARKARGPEGKAPPLVVEDQTLDLTKPGTLGNLLEPAIVELYVLHTSLATIAATTLVHPDHAWATATPDRLVAMGVGTDGPAFVPGHSQISRGLECKVVGPYMVSEWGEVPPDDVVIQCQWCMFITGLDLWDVAALLGGTGFRVFTVDRDDETIAFLFELALAFWTDNVLADEMPIVSDGKATQKVMAAKWSKDDGSTRKAPTEAAPIASDLKDVKAWIKGAKAHEARLTAQLCELVGESKGIKAEWGSFHWPTLQGGVAWKAVAESLAEHADDWDLLCEHFRADSYRKPGFYPKKAKKK
jgi:hypothetical protein